MCVGIRWCIILGFESSNASLLYFLAWKSGSMPLAYRFIMNQNGYCKHSEREMREIIVVHSKIKEIFDFGAFCQSAGVTHSTPCAFLRHTYNVLFFFADSDAFFEHAHFQSETRERETTPPFRRCVNTIDVLLACGLIHMVLLFQFL